MFVKIRSKNETADGLRDKISCKQRTVLRLGSVTPIEKIFPVGIKTGKPIRELNTVQACINSSNKITMKQLFNEAGVITAEWMVLDQVTLGEEPNWTMYPAIIKHKHSSKGDGIYYIPHRDDLATFIQEHNGSLQNFIIEKYYTYVKEYRLHVMDDGCFYTCRKMLQNDAVERWHRHDSNSVWILEENELFDKPETWNDLVAECVKAKNAVGLDISAIDVKVNKEGKFIILETNSAPSLGEVTTVKYIEKLTQFLNE